MRIKFSWLVILISLTLGMAYAQDGKLNVIIIGAHPDDPDSDAGGTAIKFAKMGHHVEMVALTNGDAGHQTMGGGQLARIRREEARLAGERYGVKYITLENHDGELMPTIENRKKVIRLIREWKADIVISPRPWDYHPDHRYTGVLVQDAAYMVIVPNVVTDVPPLEKNPLFLYSQDHFRKPNPFSPDIVVDISDVYEQKIYAMSAHKSQYFEWLPWTVGKLGEVPSDPQERLKWLAETRSVKITDGVRKSLVKWYGSAKAQQVTQAEAFEICEYGRQPSDEEIRQLFPMLGK